MTYPSDPHDPLAVTCTCEEEECTTQLELTLDGMLAIEDADGLKLSLMLPNWLDDAMQTAWAKQRAEANEATLSHRNHITGAQDASTSNQAGAGEDSLRIPGCESTNHTECYGVLWQCANCSKSICWAEGTDHDPDICDECWAEKYQHTMDSHEVTKEIP